MRGRDLAKHEDQNEKADGCREEDERGSLPASQDGGDSGEERGHARNSRKEPGNGKQQVVGECLAALLTGTGEKRKRRKQQKEGDC